MSEAFHPKFVEAVERLEQIAQRGFPEGDLDEEKLWVGVFLDYAPPHIKLQIAAAALEVGAIPQPDGFTPAGEPVYRFDFVIRNSVPSQILTAEI